MDTKELLTLSAAGVGAYLLSAPTSERRVNEGEKAKQQANIKIDNLYAALYSDYKDLSNRLDQAEAETQKYTHPFEVTSFIGIIADYMAAPGTKASTTLWYKNISWRWWVYAKNITNQQARLNLEQVSVKCCDSAQAYAKTWQQTFDFGPGEAKWICLQLINKKPCFPDKKVLLSYLGSRVDWKDFAKEQRSGSTYVVDGSIAMKYRTGISFDGSRYEYDINETKDLFLTGHVVLKFSITNGDTGIEVVKSTDAMLDALTQKKLRMR